MNLIHLKISPGLDRLATRNEVRSALSLWFREMSRDDDESASDGGAVFVSCLSGLIEEDLSPAIINKLPE